MQAGDLQLLVADADDFQRRWLCAVLEGLGARHIEEVADGQAAFARLHDGAPRVHIGFLDLTLPGMDTIDIVRQLGDAHAEAALVLVGGADAALTYSVEALVRACGLNLLGSIDKPAAPEEVEALLRRFRHAPAASPTPPARPLPSDAELLRALDEDQFEPRFQPKVALADGQVHGMEAFARWRHPQHGLLGPDSFIPSLERLGRMGGLSWLMLEKSVAASRHWAAAGYRLPVSLNLSPSTLAEAGFAERVGAFLAAQGVAPAMLVLEVTESAAVSDLPEFLENLARLRMLGCVLSVDDFGTGQTSMQDMMRIPFSEVKIDRSFVAGAVHNKALEVVLSSALDMCRKLERESVAVGVETQMDWEFLKRLGCLYAQGYYIARPMAAEAVPRWLAEWAEFF